MNKIYYSGFFETLSMGTIFIENIYLAIFLFFLFHGIAIFLLSSVISVLLKMKINIKQKYLSVLTVFFLVGFFGLILGYIFLLLAIFVLKEERDAGVKLFEKFTINEVYSEDFKFNGRKFGEGSINIVSLNKNSSKGLAEKIFLYIQENLDPDTMAFVKESISSSIDEIRLMAFSLISKMEKDLNEKIYMLNEKLKEEDLSNEEKAEIYLELGQIYWNFIIFKIVDEEMRKFFIEKTIFYVKESLNIKENFLAYFLLGRIYLYIKDYIKAKEYLTKAYFSNKVRKNKVIPYLVECYFYEKEYDMVKRLFSELDTTPQVRTHFMKILWCKENDRDNQ